MGSKEGGSRLSPLLPSLLLEETLPTNATPQYYKPINAVATAYHYGSFLMEHSFTSFLHSSPDISLTYGLEASDRDALADMLFAADTDQDMSEDNSVSLSHLANIQSTQSSQKMQGGPLPGDAPAYDYPSTSGISGPRVNPLAVDRKPPAPSFRADLLTDSPSQSAGPSGRSVLAQKRLPHPLPQTSAQTRESENQCSPKNISPKSSFLDGMSLSVECHCTAPVPTNTSSGADSYQDSCDRQVDGNSPDFVPNKQILEASKGLQATQELASSGISSKLGTGERSETKRKCQKNTGGARTVTSKPTAVNTREVIIKTLQRIEEDCFKGTTNVVKTTHSQRRSGQTKKDKAIKNGEFIKEREDDRKSNQKGVKTVRFTLEKDKVIYEKQKKESSGQRLLCKGKESNLQEQSQAAETTNTVQQFSEMRKYKHQKDAGKMQKLKAEPGEQHGANNTLENALLIIRPREKKETRDERVKREEGIQMSRFVRIRNPSREPTASRATGTLKYSETQRNEMKSSPNREILDKLDVNVKANANKQPVSSLIKKSGRHEKKERANNANEESTAHKVNKDKVSENCRSTSHSESSLHGTNTVTADLGRHKAASVEINKAEHPISCLKLSSVKTCKKNPRLPPTPESIQLTDKQSETVVQRQDVDGPHKAETWDLYSLKSLTHKQKVSKKVISSPGSDKNMESEAPNQSSSSKPSPDQTSEVRAENEGINEDNTSLRLSQVKRFYQEHEASQEETNIHKIEKLRIKTEMQCSSPTKKARLKTKREVKSARV